MAWNNVERNMKSKNYMNAFVKNLSQYVYTDEAADAAFEIACEIFLDRKMVEIHGIFLNIRRINDEEVNYTRQYTDRIVEAALKEDDLDIDKCYSHERYKDNLDDKVYEHISSEMDSQISEIASKFSPVLVLLKHVMKEEKAILSQIEETLEWTL